MSRNTDKDWFDGFVWRGVIDVERDDALIILLFIYIVLKMLEVNSILGVQIP